MIDAFTLCLLTNHRYTFKAHLDSEFEINNLCTAKKYQVLKLQKKKIRICSFLASIVTISKFFYHFNMLNAKSITTPIAPHLKLSSTQCLVLLFLMKVLSIHCGFHTLVLFVF
jgi:hypothetical protein